MKKLLLTLSALAIAAAFSSCASAKKDSCCADGKGACCTPEVVCTK
ncbi:MAG: hypothetical protein KDN19_05460 [Verrucomicrobiae bacterium]|nr:hypothetical protein [Verrucomicrobiae bacterium]